MKAKILTDFQICVSVPLNILTSKYKQTHYARLDFHYHWSNRQTIQRKPCENFLKDTCSETTMKCL